MFRFCQNQASYKSHSLWDTCYPFDRNKLIMGRFFRVKFVKDELLLGYGNHVSPLLPPRSPPAPRTIVPVEGDPETWRDPIAEAHSGDFTC